MQGTSPSFGFIKKLLFRHSALVTTTAAVMVLAWFIWAIGRPVGKAFQIGPDEHHEVMKAFLVSNGYKLYDPIWDDQPPLHTLLLAFLFRFFGPTIVIARILAVVFALLLFIRFFLSVKEQNGYCPAAVAIFCLLTAPEVLNLSVSAMLEVPAWAIGLWSLWPLQQCYKSPRFRSVLVSAILFAIALQIKLTAGLLAPALCTEIIAIAVVTQGRFSFIALCYTLVWMACVLVIFLALGLCFGSGYGQAWTSHFSPEARRSLEMESYAFSIDALLKHKEALCGAALALAAFPFLTKKQNLLFPVVLLVTVGFVHSLHRPWWPFYYLHFAIPLAWLSGYAVIAVQQLSADLRINCHVHRFSLSDRIGILVSTSLLIVFAIYGGQRLRLEIESLRNRPQIQDSNLVAKMKEAAGRTKWVYTPATMYAFHAHLLVPPELAVLVKKRFWCGQITEMEIANLIRKYQPEQLLLPLGLEHSQDYDFVAVKYREVYAGEGFGLYVQLGIFTNASPSLGK